MKKTRLKMNTASIFLCLMLLILSAGCGSGGQGTKAESQTAGAGDVMESKSAELETAVSSPASDEVDVDLTTLSSTMVYSEVYNMMVTPSDYIGKTVRMSGTFSRYHDDSTGVDYYACVIQDATACCAQGLEFSLTDAYSYPDDYPEEGETICVVGTFNTYQEGESTYCQLKDARLES